MAGEIEYRTGTHAPETGVYVCAQHPSQRVSLREGDLMPRCAGVRGGHDAEWRLADEVAAGAGAGRRGRAETRRRADEPHEPEEGRRFTDRFPFRFSWGAVFAGLIVALMVHTLLSLAGLAVGLSAWDPGDPLGALGTGALIWGAVAGLIALFGGGVVAGRLAGVVRPLDGVLHGVVLWGLATLTLMWLAASGLGMIAGGAFSVLGQGVSAAAEATAGAAAGGGVDLGELDPTGMREDIIAALERSGVPELQPGRIEAAAETVPAPGGQPPTVSNEELADAIIAESARQGGQIDRQEIASVITEETNLSRSDADRAAAEVNEVYRTASRQLGAGLEEVGARAEETARQATDVAAEAAGWSLLALLLGAVAAAGGAALTART